MEKHVNTISTQVSTRFRQWRESRLTQGTYSDRQLGEDDGTQQREVLDRSLRPAEQRRPLGDKA